MNLLKDTWMTASLKDGISRRIRPAEVVDPEVLDIMAPRPDFRGALYQFLIGLLQSTFAPEDWDDWKELWMKPPTVADLDEVFTRFASAFELDSAGPAFMQDFEPLGNGDSIDVGRLLIETPGNKTVSNNNDHFVHRATSSGMCFPCAAMALFTLQINAPGGGAGNRVSLRGGGPMTTLRLPVFTSASLWHKLWSNVTPAKCIVDTPDAAVFPWLAPTRTSQTEGGIDTTPEEVDHRQAFWSMPRRIRMNWRDFSSGTCTVCGEASSQTVVNYRTRPHGVNYAGAWVHPLTPYIFDPKQEKPPASIKGQPSGIGYRQWLGWTFGDEVRRPATLLAAFARENRMLPQEVNNVTLWCFGYDMDKMKARCWYDATLPLPSVAPAAVDALCAAVRRTLSVAIDTAASLRKTVGAATNPDGNCDEAVPQSFWQRSERLFYRFLEGVVAVGPDQGVRVGELSREFLQSQHQLALNLFDEWVLAAPMEQLPMKKVVKARAELEQSTWKKSSKQLREWIQANQEVVA